jgi:hypothetical protein
MYRCLSYRYRYDYSASSAAANTIAALVVALEDAKEYPSMSTIFNPF